MTSTPLDDLRQVVEAGTPTPGFIRDPFPEFHDFNTAARRLARFITSPEAAFEIAMVVAKLREAEEASATPHRDTATAVLNLLAAKALDHV